MRNKPSQQGKNRGKNVIKTANEDVTRTIQWKKFLETASLVLPVI